jgi:hypothetical protein
MRKPNTWQLSNNNFLFYTFFSYEINYIKKLYSVDMEWYTETNFFCVLNYYIKAIQSAGAKNHPL